MREEILGHGDNHALQLSPTCSYSLLDSATTLRSSQESTMAQKGAGRNCSSRKQRHGGLNPKILLLSVLAAAPGAMAQGCVSLSGSKLCPAFSAASISTTDSTVTGY